MIINEKFTDFINFINATFKTSNNAYSVRMTQEEEQKFKCKLLAFKQEVETNLLKIMVSESKARYLVGIIETLKKSPLCGPGPGFIFWTSEGSVGTSIKWIISGLAIELRDQCGPMNYAMTNPIETSFYSKTPLLEASIELLKTMEDRWEKNEFVCHISMLLQSMYTISEVGSLLEEAYSKFNMNKAEFFSQVKSIINQSLAGREQYALQDTLNEQRNNEWLQNAYKARDFIFNWIEEKENNKKSAKTIKAKNRERKPHASTLKRKEEIASYFHELIKSKIEYSKAIEQTAKKYTYSEKQIRRYLDIDK
jgi:hypothetical protein